ncbi:hypothetical protein EV714DRAFT_248249 [Schizophyllum commune]
MSRILEKVKSLRRSSLPSSKESSAPTSPKSATPRNSIHHPRKKGSSHSRDASRDVSRPRKIEELERVAVEKRKTLDYPDRFGRLPLVMSEGDINLRDVTLTPLDTVSSQSIGQDITFRARLHARRNMSSHLAFFVFRQGMTTLQGVLEEHDSETEPLFIAWSEHIQPEAILQVSGTLKTPKVTVKYASLHDVELQIKEMHIVSEPTVSLPFRPYQVNASDHTRLEHRVIDLRTPPSNALFRLNAAVCRYFRNYLDDHGFIEIHSPKLQGSATESGSSVFPVEYFGRKAFLAQSPQLAKQMAISADLGRVFEIGPVFRAENSNTHRHLTEYTGLDIEMAFQHHYHETMYLMIDLLKNIFKNVYEHNRPQIEVLKQAFPHDDLVWTEETPVIPFKEGIRMLKESGWEGDVSEDDDLGTRDEIRLGELVKEKYHTDFYVLDKFPVAARPFYAMLDPKDKRFTNSFDMFIRGQEIMTGGQRIHEPAALLRRMRDAGVVPAGSLEEYMKAFEWGCPPHAGAGVGLERILMLMFKLGNIRFASMFPRDPKSLPEKIMPPPPLFHPDCDTTRPPWFKKPLTEAQTGSVATSDVSTPASESSKSAFIPSPEELTDEEIERLMPLTHLIANYGDASNTSALDARYRVWRSHRNGAAVGYSKGKGGYVIVVGNPLCDESQYKETIDEFLPWLKKNVGKPIWILVSSEVERILAESYDWRCISCVAEDRIDPKVNRGHDDAVVMRKARHAKRSAVHVVSTQQGQLPAPELIEKVNKRIEDWKASRNTSGKQVHLTDVAPWVDYEHRTYFVALGPSAQNAAKAEKAGGVKEEGKENQVNADEVVHGLVVLAQLSRKHGYQIKWAIEFPDAISGTVEATVLEALDYASEHGAESVTFGTGATAHVEIDSKHGLAGKRLLIKMLQHTYHTIATELKLLNKSDFRRKMGATEDPVWLCFPKRSLGPRGIRALVTFFQGGEESDKGEGKKAKALANGGAASPPNGKAGSGSKGPAPTPTDVAGNYALAQQASKERPNPSEDTISGERSQFEGVTDTSSEDEDAEVYEYGRADIDRARDKQVKNVGGMEQD